MSKLREAARDQPCIRCGRQDGTTVGAHYTGVRRLELGGGFGRKVHDMAMAHLCAECHRFAKNWRELYAALLREMRLRERLAKARRCCG